MAWRRRIGANHPPAALNGDVVLSARDLRRQRDFKFHLRADIERGVSLDVHSGRAQITGDRFVLVAGLSFMNANWQLQRETLPRPVFRHGTSSRPALQQSR